MDISIIVLNWNSRQVTLDCLRSIYGQICGCSKEVIVVDNGSSDGSQEAIRADFPDAYLLQNSDNQGFAAANNRGMRQSSGRYICLVNSDVVLKENCLERLLTFMDSNPRVGMVGPRILNPDGSLQDSCRKFPSLWNNFCGAVGLSRVFANSRFFSGEHMMYFNHDSIREVDYLAGCFLMARREAVDRIGLLDERFFIYQEEVDWCKRFSQQNITICYFPDAMAVHHHGVSSSADPKRFALAREKSMVLYWSKYHGALGAFGIRSIIFLGHALRIVPRGIIFWVKAGADHRLRQRLAIDIACIRSILKFRNSH